MPTESQPIDLFARQLGSETNPPIVILHGLLGTSDNWQSLGKRFAQTHWVHLVDQRNHGRSPHHPVHDYPSMAEDLRRYLDSQHIDRAHILGHSMGGKTALFFAHRHPQRVLSLIIADMAARAYAPHHQPIFDALQTAPIRGAERREAIETYLLKQLDDPMMVAFLMKNLRREKSGQFAWRPNLRTLADSLAHIVDEAPLEFNTLRTLLLYGGQSNYVNASDVASFQAQCVQFESHEIAEAGHWLHASHPDEFFEEVDAFLNA